MSVLWQLETYMNEANEYEAEWKNEKNDVHQKTSEARNEEKKKMQRIVP